MTAFTVEQKVFEDLRNNCPPKTKKEYLQGIERILDSYNPSIRLNRFITGTAIELLTFSMIKSVVPRCRWDKTGDSRKLILQNSKTFSVESITTGKLRDIKLINKDGSGRVVWNNATLFVISGKGIVYGDQEKVGSHLDDSGDALKLKKAGLEKLILDKTNVFELEIPLKPELKLDERNYKQSEIVAYSVMMQQKKLKTLLTAFNSE